MIKLLASQVHVVAGSRRQKLMETEINYTQMHGRNKARAHLNLYVTGVTAVALAYTLKTLTDAPAS